LVIFRLVLWGCKVNKSQGLNLTKQNASQDTMPLVTRPQTLRPFSNALLKTVNCRKWNGYIDFNIS